MVSPYIKAAVVTLLLAALGFLVISQIDAARAREVQSSIDGLLFDSESSRLLFLYAQTVGTDDPEFCGYLNETMAAQVSRTNEFAGKITEYERASLFSQEYESIKRRYYVSNAELYMYVYAAGKYCGQQPVLPVLFFYRVKGNCPECLAQGAVLDGIVRGCGGIRVFAFPIDTDHAFINVLAAKHDVKTAPAIVFPDGSKREGLSDRGQVLSGLQRAGVLGCLGS